MLKAFLKCKLKVVSDYLSLHIKDTLLMGSVVVIRSIKKRFLNKSPPLNSWGIQCQIISEKMVSKIGSELMLVSLLN